MLSISKIRRSNRFCFTAAILSVLIFMLVLPGCESAIRTESQKSFRPAKETSIDPTAGYVKDINDLGINTLRFVCSDQNGKNMLVSPLSLSTALSILDYGAGGNTRDQINALINKDGLSPEDLSIKYYELISSLYTDEGSKIIIANSLWVDKAFKLKQNFADNAKSCYDADIFSADFRSSGTVKDVNRWISDKTKNLIKNPISRISPDTIAMIVNTLYFKGEWGHKFEKGSTQKEDFKLSNGDVVKVDMMNQTLGNGIYYENENLKALELGYKGGASMLFILPESDPDSLLGSMTADTINQIYDGLSSFETDVKVPKFDFSSNNSLADCLKSLGMTDAFSDKSDLSGIIDSAAVSPYVSDVLHDCKIKLDEEGTVAAAATVVMMAETAIQPAEEKKEFYLDRPFIFAIIDDASRTVLFLGKVENPNED